MAEPKPIKETVDSRLEIMKNNSSSEGSLETPDQEKEKKHGGARPGAGKPKGKLSRKTLEAMKVKEAFNQRVLQHADDLFNAQLQLATGEQVLMVKIKERDSKGKVLRTYFEQVTNVELIKQYLDYHELSAGEIPEGTEDPNDDEHFYFLSTKPANNQALDSLINRALGKVPEKLEVDGGFFNQTDLTIKVVGSKHDDIDIGEDGQIRGVESSDSGDSSGADPVGETGPSDSPVEPPASS